MISENIRNYEADFLGNTRIYYIPERALWVVTCSLKVPKVLWQDGYNFAVPCDTVFHLLEIVVHKTYTLV